jgi:hypothetical protein
MLRTADEPDDVVEPPRVPELRARDAVARPSHLVDEPVLRGAEHLQAWQRHLDQHPLDVGHESLPCCRVAHACSSRARRRVIHVRPESCDQRQDLGLAALVLSEDPAVVVGHGVQPVRLHHVLRELSRGDRLGRLAPSTRVLEAEVDESQEHCVLVGRREAPAVEQFQEAPAELDRPCVATHRRLQ